MNDEELHAQIGALHAQIAALEQRAATASEHAEGAHARACLAVKHALEGKRREVARRYDGGAADAAALVLEEMKAAVDELLASAERT